MKITTLITAVTVGLISVSAAYAEGKNPAEAILQNIDKNNSFTILGDVDSPAGAGNDNVRFGVNDGAMRSLNGKAFYHAADNSAVDTVDPKQGKWGGTRVVPTRGLKSAQTD